MKQKQEVPLSFKISNAMDARLEQECSRDNGRDKSAMAKILIDEALSIRDALDKSNRRKYL